MKESLATVLAAASMLLAASAVACGGDSATSPTSVPVASAPSAPAQSAVTSTPTAHPAAGATASPATAPSNTPAPAARPTQPPAPPTATPPPPSIALTVVAKGVRFVPNALSAPVGALVNVTLDNQDNGVPHDITFFDPAGTRVAGTEIATGPNTSSTTFTPVGTGSYSFKCTVHPFQMTGSLSVQ